MAHSALPPFGLFQNSVEHIKIWHLFLHESACVLRVAQNTRKKESPFSKCVVWEGGRGMGH